MKENRLIYSKTLKETEHIKNINVDGRVFYNEWYRNKVRRYELYFWGRLKIESSVCCFLVASDCSWLIEVTFRSSDLLNVSILANRYYSWVVFEPTLSNDTKAHTCDFALSLTTGNLESWFRYMDTYFPLLCDAFWRQQLWCDLIWQTRILPILKFIFFLWRNSS
jgi:hypothetical protein